MVPFRFGGMSAAVFAMVLLTSGMMGIAHGADATSLDDARIEDRMTPGDFEDGQPHNPVVPDAWQQQIEDISPEPNPWVQDKVQSFAMAMGNTVFRFTDAAAVWGYQNRGWISPAWALRLTSVAGTGAVLALVAYQLNRVRTMYAEASR